MPEFSYQGVTKAGKRVDGKISAENEGEVRVILRGQGIRPTRLGEVGLLQSDLGSLFKGSGVVSFTELVPFTRQLHVLIGSGVPLVQALDILTEQATSPTLKNILSVIKEKVSGGSFLWEALSMYPRAFSKLYVSLIRAGEAAGAMEVMLKRLSRYLEDAARLQKLIKGAMIYPISVILVGIVVILIMLGFVIPRFEQLLTTSGQELPGPTKFVIDVSHFVAANFHFIVIGAAVIGYMSARYARSEEGRTFLQTAGFRLPLFGVIIQKSGVARFCRTMGTLLSSGVNLLDAIEICRTSINNVVLEDAIAKIRGEVEAGRTLGSVIAKIPVFPVMATQMISVGESTGSLDKMLEKVADYYEEEVESLVAGMTKLIEPIVLVVLGGTVAGLMIAMYLPIFKMAGAAGS